MTCWSVWDLDWSSGDPWVSLRHVHEACQVKTIFTMIPRLLLSFHSHCLVNVWRSISEAMGCVLSWQTERGVRRVGRVRGGLVTHTVSVAPGDAELVEEMGVFHGKERKGQELEEGCWTHITLPWPATWWCPCAQDVLGQPLVPNQDSGEKGEELV